MLIGTTFRLSDPCRTLYGPLGLMFACPLIASGLARINAKYQGDLYAALFAQSFQLTDWFPYFEELRVSMIQIIIFALFQVFLLKFLPPQQIIEGPITPGGLRPKYVNNGIHAMAVTLLLFVGLSDMGIGNLYPIDIWVLNLPGLVICLNFSALMVCFWLFLRTYWIPHSKDYKSTNNLIFDFYYGRELHPVFLGQDIKQFTNCRFGMMLWVLVCISCVGHEYKVLGVVSNASFVAFFLQLGYLIKFFYWEDGYFYTIDMACDKCGYYLVWGCMTFVPTFYTNVSIFLSFSQHSEDMSTMSAIMLGIFGFIMLGLNYHSDLQRKQFRETKDYYILGTKAKYIEAKYFTSDGLEHTNKLLVSGYWGWSRHFNYLTEILFALSYAIPCSYTGSPSFVGYFYVIFLTVLLIDRTYRDDQRCHAKYGAYWIEYCRRVPYRIIPYIF